MTIKKRLIFVTSAFCLWCCSNSTSETEDPILEDELAEFSDVLPADSTGNGQTDSLPSDTNSLDSSFIVDTIEIEPLVIDGMLPVAASSKAVGLGTNNKNAPEKEKPQMKVVLDYDFMMARHETTCGEFVSTMKKFGPKNSFAGTYKCKNDSLPIADVTYYDAILFANAKTKEFLASQAEDSSATRNDIKIDSVYDYAQTVIDEEGHCTNLVGFIFHPDRNGFRLPTEAEWIKAASTNWDPTYSWNVSNSNFMAHNVCTKASGDSAFCDLAGNVMEWTNDWLGKFKDTTITNYVGAPDGGELGERVVKGGNFNTEIKSLDTYSRGDVYTVTSSTRADYVGFRLAYGAIPNPTWMNDDGSATNNIITALASSFDIYSYTKSYNMKLAFRNDVTGNLAYIDYSSGSLSVIEIQDTINVYHPEISPDGERVAFSTTPEGITGKSSLYVRNLDKTGSGIVKLDVSSATIPRWRVLQNGDTVIVFVTDAGSNKTESEWKKYSTWQVPFSGGIFGIPEKLMDGSFHGGISEDNRLAVTGARLLRARMANSDGILNKGKDSLWYNGEQACNASMAQDGSKRTAFLDFGGATGRAYIGNKYKMHQYLLVADSTGALKQYAAAPAGYAFDHTEWTVGAPSDNLVGTLTNTNGAHQKIVLVNLEKNETVDLAEGDELWHPSFWIKGKKKRNISSSSVPVSSSSAENQTSSDSQNTDTGSSNTTSSSSPENQSSSDPEITSSESISSSSAEPPFELDPDSAGMYYNNSGANSYALDWRYRMEFVWTYRDSTNVAIVGSSRPNWGILPKSFSPPIFAVNFAVSSSRISNDYFLLENYLFPHAKKMKAIIIGVDLDLWYDTVSTLSNTIDSYPGYRYDYDHDFWKDQYPEGLDELTYDSPGSKSYADKVRPTRGAELVSAKGWEPLVFGKDSTWLSYSQTKYEASFNKLLSIVKKSASKDIKVIGVIFPQAPGYKETGAFGKGGLLRSEAPELIQKIANISNNYPNFILMDENKMGDHDYTDDMARDCNHLAQLGAEQLTHRLDSLIQTLNIDFEN